MSRMVTLAAGAVRQRACSLDADTTALPHMRADPVAPQLGCTEQLRTPPQCLPCLRHTHVLVDGGHKVEHQDVLLPQALPQPPRTVVGGEVAPRHGAVGGAARHAALATGRGGREDTGGWGVQGHPQSSKHTWRVPLKPARQLTPGAAQQAALLQPPSLQQHPHRQLGVDVLPLRRDAGQLLQEQPTQLPQLPPLLRIDVQGAGNLRHTRVCWLPRHVVHLSRGRAEGGCRCSTRQCTQATATPKQVAALPLQAKYSARLIQVAG